LPAGEKAGRKTALSIFFFDFFSREEKKNASACGDEGGGEIGKNLLGAKQAKRKT